MKDEEQDSIAAAIRSLSEAVYRAAVGDTAQPGPLEAIAMSIAGVGLTGDLCSSIDGLAMAIEMAGGKIADAIVESKNHDPVSVNEMNEQKDEKP